MLIALRQCRKPYLIAQSINHSFACPFQVESRDEWPSYWRASTLSEFKTTGLGLSSRYTPVIRCIFAVYYSRSMRTQVCVSVVLDICLLSNELDSVQDSSNSWPVLTLLRPFIIITQCGIIIAPERPFSDMQPITSFSLDYVATSYINILTHRANGHSE